MNRLKLCTALWVLGAAAAPVLAQNITNVVEINGDNEATDTISAKWTGQTFNTTIANEPTPNTPVGTPFTVPTFGHQAPAFVDRNHRYSNHSVDAAAVPPGFTIPAYLIGGEYIMSGNDNRDNQPPTIAAPYQLDVTIANPSTVYMLIDNRMSADTAGTDNADPPTFDATHMQWILDQGWAPTANGLNRTANPLVPDEVPIDEGADNTINQWYSVYQKQFQPGTFSLHQPDNAGQNMYGVVVVAVPEPSAFALLGFAALALGARRKTR
jgi:hypothetical protein